MVGAGAGDGRRRWLPSSESDGEGKAEAIICGTCGATTTATSPAAATAIVGRWALMMWLLLGLLLLLLQPPQTEPRRQAGGGGKAARPQRQPASDDASACAGAGGAPLAGSADAAALTEAGNAHFRDQRHEGARGCYERALAIKPGFLTAVLNIGLIQLLEEEFEEAEASIREAIRLSPEYAYAHQSLGNFHASTRPRDGGRAIAAYIRAYEIDPQLGGIVVSLLDATVRHHDALMQRGLAAEAERTLRELAVPQMPPEVHGAAAERLITLVRERGRPDEALEVARIALASNPADTRVRLGQAVTYRTMGELDKALGTLAEAVRINPLDVEVTANYGLALSHSGRKQEAIQVYKQAVKTRPDFVEAYVTLGDACADIFDYRCAITNYRAALKVRPGHVPAITALVVKRAYICDWGHYVDGDYAILEQLSAEQVDGRSPVERPAMTPFHALTLPFDPLYILQLAKAYAGNALRSAEMNQIPTFTNRVSGQNPSVLKVGYLSCDFGDHPVGRLFALVPQYHSENVEVTLYALNPSDRSIWRKHVERTADHFVDLSTVGMRAAAEMIHADGIHVLVDLMGYTGGAFAVNRDAIMAARPAPLAISMLGYPSTVGSDFVDYVVTDRIITPPEVKSHFVEKFMYVPYSYQVNSQAMEDKIVGAAAKGGEVNRATYGLPSEYDRNALVLSCFNSLYKIDPAVLTVWVNVLRRVPFSVLWLLNMPDQAKRQILAEAGARGLSADRLVFSDPVPHPEHLERAALADLFLDTLNYNAHTTATDALWTGVPIVTMAASDKMQSRVAAGLTTAAGFPEAVMHSLQQYEDEVVDLAAQTLQGKRQRLEATRRRMLEVREESPYFKAEGWVRCFEVGLRKAWKYRRRKEVKGLNSLPHIVIDPESCRAPAASSEVPDDLTRALFTPEPVVPVRRRTETVDQAVPASQPTPPPPSPLAPTPPPTPATKVPKKSRVARASGDALPPGERCHSSKECASEHCGERCCNEHGGASIGCLACDLLGDCVDCGAEFVLFADACRPRGPSPWIEATTLPTDVAAPREIGDLHSDHGTRRLKMPALPPEGVGEEDGEEEEAREEDADSENHSGTDEEACGVSAAREKLRELVSQLREAVAEEPSMAERLRKHGYELTDDT